MGWYFGCQTKKEQIEELRTDRTVKSCLRGSILWSVEEDMKGHNYIMCYLLRKAPDGYWGYKPIEASMGPCYYSCPLSYLDLAPPANRYDIEWREYVMEYHKEQAEKRARKKAAKKNK